MRNKSDLENAKVVDFNEPAQETGKEPPYDLSFVHAGDARGAPDHDP